MLLDLKVLNGEFSPVFDKYVDTYSVKVNNDIDSLVFDYKLEEGYEIEIINNENFQDGSNYVFLEVKGEDEVNTYTIEVYKEKEKAVINYEELMTPVEISDPMPEYIPPLIIGSCLLIILITFMILFKKKKKH